MVKWHSSSWKPQSYGASPAVWDHTAVTCHLTQVLTRPAITPARQAGSLLDLPNPEGWKAELTLGLVICGDGLPVRRQSRMRTRLMSTPDCGLIYR